MEDSRRVGYEATVRCLTAMLAVLECVLGYVLCSAPPVTTTKY